MATKRVNADLEVAGEVISGGENLNQKIDYLEYLLPEAPLPLDSMELEAGQVILCSEVILVSFYL